MFKKFFTKLTATKKKVILSFLFVIFACGFVGNNYVFAAPGMYNASDYNLSKTSNSGISQTGGVTDGNQSFTTVDGKYLYHINRQGTGTVERQAILGPGYGSHETVVSGATDLRYNPTSQKWQYSRYEDGKQVLYNVDATASGPYRASEAEQQQAFPSDEDKGIIESIKSIGESLNPTVFVGKFFKEAVAWIGNNILLKWSSLIVALTGKMLDYVLGFTIFNISGTLGAAADGSTAGGIMASIDKAWTMIRDISNIIFIFLILLTAIQIILAGDLYGKKKTLINIIVVALLINFSLFFTKIVFDVSNLATTGIYNSIRSSLPPPAQQAGANAAANPSTLGGVNVDLDDSLAMAVLSRLGMTTFYQWPSSVGTLSASQDILDIFVIGIFAFIFMGIVSIMFMVMAGLFLWRFIVFIILMITSPVAFMGIALPQAKGILDRWKKALFAEALFPPTFFIMFYIVLLLLQGFVGNTVGSFADLASPEPTKDSTIGLIVQFVLVIAFLNFAIVQSRKMSAEGSEKIQGVINAGTRFAAGSTFGVAARVGRNTVGRAGNLLAESGMVKNLEAGGAFARSFGGALKNIGEKSAKASFDGRNTGIAKILKDVDLGKNETGNKGYANVLKEQTKEFGDLNKRIKDKTFREQDAIAIRDGAKNVKAAKHFAEEEAIRDKIKKYEEAKARGDTTTTVAGQVVSLDSALRNQQTKLATHQRTSQVTATEKKEYTEFIKKNNLSNAEVITKFEKYTKAENSKALEKQTKIANRADQRQKDLIKTLEGGTWSTKIIDKLSKDRNGVIRSSKSATLALGTLKIAHWALGTGASTRSDAGRAAASKIAEESSKKKKNEEQLKGVLKAAGIGEETNTPPTGAPPPPGGAPPPPGR